MWDNMNVNTDNIHQISFLVVLQLAFWGAPY